MRRLRGWFELCRLPWSIAVAGDALAGALLARAGFVQLPVVLLLMLGTMLLHAGAVALNDWHDFKADRVEHPGRPLPAGTIGRWRCLAVAIVLGCVGLGMFFVAGMKFGQAGLVLACIVLIYEFLLKGAPAAATIPGVARAVAMFAGMLTVPVDAAGVSWSARAFFLAMLACWSFAGMLLAWRCPDHARRGFAVAGAVAMALAAGAVAMSRAFFPQVAVNPAAAAWIGLLMIVAGVSTVRAIVRPTEAHLANAAAYTMIGSLILEAAMVAFVRGVPVSILVAMLAVPVVYARKWLACRDLAIESTSNMERPATASS